MKSTLKSGFSLMVRLIVLLLLEFFLVLSINFICSMAFTENTGYIAYGYVENEEDTEYLYTYYYEDGEDTKRAEYESVGYTLTLKSARSALSGTGKAVFLSVSQIIGFIIMASFVFAPNYQQGFKDSNMVRIGRMKEDKFKGLKIGLFANIPYFLLFAAFLICGLGAFTNMPISVYRLLNSHLYGFIDLIGTTTATAGELAFWQYALLFALQLIVPAISAVSYYMGYKGIDVVEKIVYVKKEDK